jgi:5-methylcytosine-specific restriction endonuclease McrA
VRDQVRQRAADRCEYCRRPRNAGYFSFHVDHIRAIKHGGSSNADNLAWACFYCNNGKGTDLSSYDAETNTITPLFNPRTQSWFDHFEMNGPHIVGITPTGRVTTRLLNMNRENQVEIRQRLLEAGVW